MAGGNGTRSSIFLSFGSRGSSPDLRLYAFAHAGGTAATYAPWALQLKPLIGVVGVELPGHGTRGMEGPVSDVHEMALEVAGAIQENQAGQQPFAFYGHSLGAIVAYETARLLASEGLTPSHLFVGAARAPHLPPVTPKISHLCQEEFLVAVQARYGGIPAAVLNEPELLEMILPAMRADFAAYENYVYDPGSTLLCPITTFTGSRDPIVREEAVAAWSAHTTGPFRPHIVPGDHFFLAECRDQVLGILSRSMRGEAPTAAAKENSLSAGRAM